MVWALTILKSLFQMSSFYWIVNTINGNNYDYKTVWYRLNVIENKSVWHGLGLSHTVWSWHGSVLCWPCDDLWGSSDDLGVILWWPCDDLAVIIWWPCYDLEVILWWPCDDLVVCGDPMVTFEWRCNGGTWTRSQLCRRRSGLQTR